MRAIGKTAAVWALATLVAVTGAWAATNDIAMEGDYAKVSWITWVGKKGYSGYLFTTRQPDGTTYLYYVVRSGNEAPVTGYGLIPNNALRRAADGGLHLSLDTSKVRGFSTSGARAGGPITVSWSHIGVVNTVHAGASGTQTGNIREITQGTWTSSAAVARGDVLAWTIGAEQSAELGVAPAASTQIEAVH
jgi:hypothetical protein